MFPLQHTARPERHSYQCRTLSTACITRLMSSLALLRVSARTERDMFLGSVCCFLAPLLCYQHLLSSYRTRQRRRTNSQPRWLSTRFDILGECRSNGSQPAIGRDADWTIGVTTDYFEMKKIARQCVRVTREVAETANGQEKCWISWSAKKTYTPYTKTLMADADGRRTSTE